MRTQPGLLAFACAAFVAGLFAATAEAIPVHGGIAFIGSASGSQSTVMGVTSSTLTFNNPMTVNSRGGDYLGVPPGLLVDFAPISWIGQGNTAVLASNNNPEWMFDHGGSTYRMSLLSLHHGTLDLSTGVVSLSGAGLVFITGAIQRDPSPAFFDVQGFLNNLSFTVLTAGTCNINCGPPAVLVPESGSAVVLLALGVMALILFCRGSSIAA